MVGVVAAALIAAGSLTLGFGWIKDAYDKVFGTDTYVATGDVVLRRLQEQQSLVAATGVFQVPVVVCDGTPEAIDLEGDKDEDGRTPAQQLLEACDGLLDEKATVLVAAEIDAVIDLGLLGDDDVVIDGQKITVSLPPVTLSEPRVDAEDGVMLIDKDGGVPLVGGNLPDDYQARAAGAAKEIVAELAVGSGTLETGTRSAESIFGSMVASFGYADVEIISESR